MVRFFVNWALLVVSLVIAAWITRKLGLGFIVDISTFKSIIKVFIGTAILSILRSTLGKILKLIALPITILTLGLFSIIINAFVLLLSSRFGFGFTIESFSAAVVGVISLSVVQSLLGVLFYDRS